MATKEEELEQLKKLSPYSLPDNPSQSGWSTKQVKSKFYQGLFYLYNLLDESRTDVSNLEQALEGLNLEDFVTEEEAQQIKNDAMPYVGTTPPDVTKTKIWFDTTPQENYIDIDELNSVEENLTEQEYTEPLVFNEFFEPIILLNDNGDSGIVLDEQVTNTLLNNNDNGVLLEDNNDENEIILN